MSRLLLLPLFLSLILSSSATQDCAAFLKLCRDECCSAGAPTGKVHAISCTAAAQICQCTIAGQYSSAKGWKPRFQASCNAAGLGIRLNQGYGTLVCQMCGTGTSPNCENRGTTVADACDDGSAAVPPAGTGSSMCPSTHPYAYRPLDNYDYCCPVADGSAYGAARPQTCAGTPEKCAAPPCLDYAKPATGSTTGATTGNTGTSGVTTGTTGVTCGVKEAGFCGVMDFSVRDGDTLPSIATIRKTTVAVLACLNPSTGAKAGTIIKVPTKNCQSTGTGTVNSDSVNAATSRRGGAQVQWEAVGGTVLAAAVAVASVARLFV